MTDTNIATLLSIIKEAKYNKKERAHSTMGLIESNVVLYITKIVFKVTRNKYYRVFNTHVHTIKAHDCNSGYLTLSIESTAEPTLRVKCRPQKKGTHILAVSM